MTGKVASRTSRHQTTPKEPIKYAFGVLHITTTKTKEKISNVHRHRTVKRTRPHFAEAGAPPCCGCVTIPERYSLAAPKVKPVSGRLKPATKRRMKTLDFRRESAILTAW
jgi:hypothetical protein